MTAYYTHQTTALLPAMHRFVRTLSCLSSLHVAVSFQLIVHAIIKITIRGTTVPLYEIAAKQPKNKLN